MLRQLVPRLLDGTLHVTEQVARVAAWIGGTLFVLIAGLIGVEVVLRRVFAITTRGADEISYYVLAVSTSWALTFTLLKRAHIRVDALYSRFGGNVRAALDVFATLLLAAFAWTATYQVGTGVLARTIERGSRAPTPLETPLWIPQSLWFAGLVLFALATTVILLRISWALLVERNPELVQTLAGSPTYEDEVDEAKELTRQAIEQAEPEAN